MRYRNNYERQLTTRLCLHRVNVVRSRVVDGLASFLYSVDGCESARIALSGRCDIYSCKLASYELKVTQKTAGKDVYIVQSIFKTLTQKPLSELMQPGNLDTAGQGGNGDDDDDNGDDEETGSTNSSDPSVGVTGMDIASAARALRAPAVVDHAPNAPTAATLRLVVPVACSATAIGVLAVGLVGRRSRRSRQRKRRNRRQRRRTQRQSSEAETARSEATASLLVVELA